MAEVNIEYETFKEARNKLIIGFTFDMQTLASTFNTKDLISDGCYRTVSNPISPLNNTQKSTMMVDEISDRISNKAENYRKVREILASNKQYSDLIEILDGIYAKKSGPTKYRIMTQLPQPSSSGHSPALPGSELILVNIKTFLKEEDFPANQAENLGEYLGIRQGRMEDLSKKSGGDPDRLLSLVITEWLNNDREKSWPKLAKALKLCNQKLMAEKIGAEKGGRAAMDGGTETPVDHTVIASPLDAIRQPTIQQGVRVTMDDGTEKPAAKTKEDYMKNISNDKVGIAIILCNGKEFNKAAREMEKVFNNLEFSTEFMEDASIADIKDIVKIATEVKYPENYKFVFYSVGHGSHDNGKEYINVANGGRIYIEEDVTDKFQPDEATGIHEMPKLFFFDNCRGGKRDTGIEIPATESPATTKPKMPGKGNMLVAYSTHPGFEAAILRIDGISKHRWSEFLMKQLPLDQSIYEVLQKTNASLKEEYVNNEKYRKGDYKIYQAPIFYSSLSGKETINLYREANKSESAAYSTADETTCEENQKFLATLDSVQILKLLECMGLQKHSKTFEEERVNGEILLECDNLMLQEELKVTSKLHRLHLMKLIEGKYSAQNILQSKDM